MNYQREREEFIRTMAGLGVARSIANSLLRNASTIQRLAVAECNGGFPYDNGQRRVKPCSGCESGCSPFALSKEGLCPSCMAVRRIEKSLKGSLLIAEIHGDPRGCCTQLLIEGDPPRRYYVPAREY